MVCELDPAEFFVIEADVEGPRPLLGPFEFILTIVEVAGDDFI